MVTPYEMSLVRTAFGMAAERTTSEPLTNIDGIIVEEDLD
jgi:hypothetical protein